MTETRQYGEWSVLDDRPIRLTIKGRARKYLKCRCSCGVVQDVLIENLRLRRSTRCDLCRKLRSKETNTSRTHGKRYTPIYAIWNMMKQRCQVQTNKAYSYYGGRGIKVCDRWQTFENFYADVGDPPFEGASLDRINNNGNYEPGNVRWATRVEQMKNRRATKLLTYDGKSLTIKEWAQLRGLKTATLSSRIYLYGWSVEKALTVPPQKNANQFTY